MHSNIRSTFDRELLQINQQLRALVKLVDTAIGNAMQSLQEQDLALAATVIADDANINRMRFEIEESCLTLIATQQPIAGDLRSIIAVMHSTVELERMGDHASGIAKTVIKAEGEKPLKPGSKLQRMAELSREMLAECIDAFENRDLQRAKEIAAQDEIMDKMYQSLFDRLIRVMSKNPRAIPRATYMMWCGHNLERIADRVTNLAELVVFMNTGNLTEFGR